MGDNIVIIDKKCFISKLLGFFKIKTFLLLDNLCKMEDFQFFKIVQILNILTWLSKLKKR